MLGTGGWEAGGPELAAPARRGSPKSSAGRQRQRGLPGTRLQRASVCSAQCPAVAAAVESALKSSEKFRGTSMFL